MHIVRFFSLVTALVSFQVTAHAGVQCDGSNSACFFDNMPLYSQNDELIGKALLPNGGSKSMLCGPTSGAMVLQTVVNTAAAANVKATAWTNKTFIASTASLAERDRAAAQIRTMASKMSTSPTNGTNSNMLTQGAYARKADFATGTSGGANTAFPVSYPMDSYKGYIRDDKSAVILMYGYYNRTSSVSNGKTYYNYTRNGGHIIAVNGYSGDQLLIYNPWQAVKEERNITIVKKGCVGNVCENLPNLAQRSLLKASGNSFHFIDNHSRLWAK